MLRSKCVREAAHYFTTFGVGMTEPAIITESGVPKPGEEAAGEQKLWISFLALAVGCLITVGAAWLGAQKFGNHLTAKAEQQNAQTWLDQGVRLFDRRENTFVDAKVSTSDKQSAFDLVRATDIVRVVLLDRQFNAFFATDSRVIDKKFDLAGTTARMANGQVATRRVAVSAVEYELRSGRPNKASRLSTNRAKDKSKLLVQYVVPVYDDGQWVGAMVIDQDQTASFAAHSSTITKGAIVLCGVLFILFLAVGAVIYSYAAQRRHHIAQLAQARDKALAAQSQVHDVNRNVTELNRDLEQKMMQLRQAKDEGIRKAKLAQLGQLTATVAHDLRNPLGAVRTAAFLIGRKTKDIDVEIEKPLERISNGVTRCDEIITELLDFARSGDLQLETVDLDEWVINLLHEQAQRLPDVVSLQCHQGLAGRRVDIDTGSMQRALINLLTNASEAMVGKGDDPSVFTTEDPQIIVSTAMTARGAELRVSDNGPGISEENLAKIMEPLFTTKSFGVGLGLPAVEKILEQHGGGLQIDSTQGTGTTITAWIPAQKVVEEAA